MNTMKLQALIATIILNLSPLFAQTKIGQFHRPESFRDSNYVKIYSFSSPNAGSYHVTMEHYDGLGRDQAFVRCAFSPDGRDVCSYVQYDAAGRKWKEKLPFPEAMIAQRDSASVYGGDGRPFSEIVYEASPLNRISREYGPGNTWKINDRYVGTSYLANGVSGDLACYHLVMTCSGTQVAPSIEKTGMWPSGKLFVTLVRDESGREVYDFKDQNGRLILTRKKMDGRMLDTYRVYDDKGRLVAVLPPLASVALVTKNRLRTSDEEVVRYAYLYEYDERDHCIGKKLPGCGWMYYIYDMGDRLVFTQDAEQRSAGVWLFTIADVHGRVCLRGLCGGEGESLTQALSGSNVLASRMTGLRNGYMGYDISGVDLVTPVVMSVSYYDDYDFIESEVPRIQRMGMHYVIPEATLPAGNSAQTHLPLLITKWDYVQGRLTGTAERILGEDMTNDFKWSSFYYDRKGNIIQTHTTRVDEGIDVTSTSVSFTGKPVQVTVSHNYGSREELKETYMYTYDHWDRLLTLKHRIGDDSQWTTLSDLTYDAVGRIVSDKRTGNPALKSTFSYNVRSWKKSIVGPGFREELCYEPDSSQNSGASQFVMEQNLRAEWGGNISEEHVWYGNENTGTQFDKVYGYDDLSRLVLAATEQDGSVTQETYTYDDQTNMTAYYRTGPAPLEKTMLYMGNRMISVLSPGELGTGSVSYDAVGRVTRSNIQGMTSVQYNMLGHTSYVGLSDGSYVHHTYTSGGNRLASRRMGANGVMTVMSYEGNEVMENGERRMLLFDGGYVDLSGHRPRYCWYTKDHLGSVRAVFDSTGTIISSYNYRPYGEEMDSNEQLSIDTPGEPMALFPVTYSSAAPRNWQPYRFSGKESLSRVGLDLYDFGARMYSPSNMRWMTMDPLCEVHYDTSPYVYCNGDPVNLVDPDGQNPIVVGGICAVVDFGAQVGVNLIKGDDIVGAIRNVDYTSVAAAGVTGAISPGSAAKRVIGYVAIIADAAVDISLDKGLQVVGGNEEHNKPMDKAIVDVVTGAFGIDGGNAASKGITNGLIEEASSKATATLPKDMKRAATALANYAQKEGTQAGISTTVGSASKMAGEAAKSVINAAEAQNGPLFLRFEQGQVERNYPLSQYYLIQ